MIALPGSEGRPYPALASIIENFGAETSSAPDILLFGDSVMERVSRHDSDKRTLAENVAEKLRPRKVLALTRSAHNPQLFKWLLLALGAQPKRPHQIVIPINMRCFSPQWHFSPDWQFEQELAILRAYIQLQQWNFSPIADVHKNTELHRQFESVVVSYELSRCQTIGDFREVVRSRPTTEGGIFHRKRETFIFHYTHRLSPDHPKVTAAKECAELAPGALIYITPINFEAGLRYVGPHFLAIVRANVETLRTAVRADVVDWSEALPESSFFHEDLATEHLNEDGRERVASMITRTLDF